MRNGFTLVEMVIVMIVLALLAAVAIPSYQNQVRKGRRADAMDALTALQQEQERHRSQHGRYAASLAELGQPSASAGSHYTLTLTDVEARSYRAAAAAVGTQAKDSDCQVFTVRVVGGSHERKATGGAGGDTSSTCWPQ